MLRYSLILFFTIFFSTLHANTPVKVACVGDSLTYGAGAVLTSADQNLSYPAQLQLLLGSDYLVKNFGAPGHTALRNGDYSYWNSELFKKAQDFKPDIVIIQLGTNDSRKQNEMVRHSFQADYYDLVAYFQEMGAKVYVALPPPILEEGALQTSEIVLKDEIIPAIQQVAQQLQTPIINNHIALNNRSYYKLSWYGISYSDSVHLNKEGYKAMALSIYEMIAPALNISPCSIQINKYSVLPNIWWGEAKDAQSQQAVIQACTGTTPTPGTDCFAMYPYLDSPDGRARQEAQEYWDTNQCSVAEQRMHQVMD